MVTDRWTDQWTGRPIDGWTNGWTIILPHTDAIDASKNDDFLTDFAIFTKVSRANRQTNGRADGPTDAPTEGTDILSYRDGIATPKK